MADAIVVDVAELRNEVQHHYADVAADPQGDAPKFGVTGQALRAYKP